jgi:hypothetical protein
VAEADAAQERRTTVTAEALSAEDRRAVAETSLMAAEARAAEARKAAASLQTAADDLITRLQSAAEEAVRVIADRFPNHTVSNSRPRLFASDESK